MQTASTLCSAGVVRRPLGLAFDATTGLLYIVEWGASRIAVMDPATDSVLRTIGSGKGSEVGQLSHPDGMALHGCGNLLVVDCDNNRVVVFDTHSDSGTQIASFPIPSDPCSVFVDVNGKVVVGGENFICMWCPLNFKAHSLNSEKGSYIGSMWRLLSGGLR